MAGAPVPSARPSVSGTETVLIVDDEVTVRRPARRALEHWGYRVLEAADGVEGLQIHAQDADTIGLAIVDVRMPQLSGWCVLEELRARKPSLPVILISGFPAPADASPMPDAFLQKPFELAHLLQTVRQLLDGRRRTPPAMTGV